MTWYNLEAWWHQRLKSYRRARHFKRLRQMSVAFGAGFRQPTLDEQHRRSIGEATRHAHGVKEGT